MPRARRSFATARSRWSKGGELEKGDWGDTDQITLPALLTYRTLVLQPQPRPKPAAIGLLAGRVAAITTTSGSVRPARPWRSPSTCRWEISQDPGAEPDCAEVRDLAQLAEPNGTVAAVERMPNVVASLADSSYPPSRYPDRTRRPGLDSQEPGDGATSGDCADGRPLRRLPAGERAQSPRRLWSTAPRSARSRSSSNQGRQFLYFGQAQRRRLTTSNSPTAIRPSRRAAAARRKRSDRWC